MRGNDPMLCAQNVGAHNSKLGWADNQFTDPHAHARCQYALEMRERGASYVTIGLTFGVTSVRARVLVKNAIRLNDPTPQRILMSRHRKYAAERARIDKGFRGMEGLSP